MGHVGSCFAATLLAGVLCGCAAQRSPTNQQYGQIYDKPLLSSGELFASLPPAVQNTVRAEAGSAEIAKAIKDTSSGRIAYRIYFDKSEHLPPLYVASDGSLLDPNLGIAIGAAPDKTSILTGGPVTSLTLGDLPPAVVKSIQRHAPDAQVDSIDKQVRGDQTTYVINFKDRLHPALRINSDGTVPAGRGD
jgi:hypothetical protein